MAEYEITTLEQIENEIAILKKFCHDVKLIDVVELKTKRTTFESEKKCPLGFRQGLSACEECIVLRTNKNKPKIEKLEEYQGQIFQVITRYVEVDSRPMVMEIINKIKDLSGGEVSYHGDPLVLSDALFDNTYKDVLTGVYNRRYYEEIIKNKKIHCGVAMIDIDDFKIYNDVYGHDVGDEVLKIVAQTINSAIRTTDKFIRYGGDEFLLVMNDIRKEIFERQLSIISKEVEACLVTGFSAIKITMSVGGVICDGEEVKDVVSRADTLMYKAKQKKNYVLMEGEEIPIDGNKQTALIIDDSKENREILADILKNEYNVIEAKQSKDGIDLIKKYKNELVVVLLDNAEIENVENNVMRFMKSGHYLSSIPVIAIIDDGSDASIRRAFEMGVADYINSPFDAKVVYRRVYNTISLYAKQKRIVSTVSKEIIEKEKNSRIIVNILNRMIGMHNGKKETHSVNVYIFTEMLLKSYLKKTDNKDKLTGHDIFLISTAACLHDMGKLGVNDEILNKRGELTPEEYAEARRHTLYGAEMIKCMMAEYGDEPLIKYAYEICRWHHERFDGEGCPDGLVGDEIPISAQVVSLVDVYDALISERPYRGAYSPELAFKMIEDGECGTFNPVLMECLKENAEKIKELSKEEQNNDKRII